jgi:RHS repeat-associated protein
VVAIMLLVSSAQAAGVSAGSFESPGVRAAVARQVQGTGPVEVSQGGSGGSGDASAPAGDLVPSLGSAYSDTWKTGLRGYVERVYASPVNYRGSDGSWHAVDDALVPRALGGYENSANSFSLVLPESLSSSVTLSEAGRSVSFSLEGAASGLPSVSGNTATYANVLPATDLSYVSASGGVQELATLENGEAPETLRYDLSTTGGLTPHLEADGAVALTDEEGVVQFTIPAPKAFPGAAGPHAGRPLSSTLASSGSGWVLSVDTGASWLRKDLESEAVVVDPTVESSASAACNLAQEVPTTTWCSGTTTQVGYDSTHEEHHTLLQFPLSSLPQAAVVLNAKLGLYVASKSTSNAKPVGVYRMTRAWTTGATWDTYDGTHAWTTPGGDYASTEKESDASVNSSVGASTGWYYWYPTKMVQEWANTANAPKQEEKEQGYANDGLIVKDQTDNQTENLLAIDSPSATSDQPYLEVNYEPRGFGSQPQYTQLSTQLDDQLSMSVNPASGNLKLTSDNLSAPGTAGLGYSNVTEFNNLDPEVRTDGRWAETLKVNGYEYPDGSVAIWINGSVFPFIKESSGKFVTPPGIKATLCTAGNSPCPATLPEAVTWRLVFDDSSGIYVDVSDYGDEPIDLSNRYGDKLTASYKSGGGGGIESWTDTGGRKFDYVQKAYDAGQHYFYTELTDVSGSRHISNEYGPESEGGGSQLIGSTNAEGEKTAYHYESYGLTKVTLPGGQVVKLKYNSEGQITEVIRTTNGEHTEGPTTKLSYYALGSAPAPCTSTQKGTVVKDPDWTKAGAHEVLYCSNVLDEVEKTVTPSEKAPGTEKEKKEREEDPFSGGVETTAEYNPFGDESAFTAASPGNSEAGDKTNRFYGEGGVNLECELSGATKGSTACERPDKEALVTSYLYHGDKTPYSTTHVEDSQGNSTTNCYNKEKQERKKEEEEATCSASEAPEGSLADEKDSLSEQNEPKFAYASDGNVEKSTDADGHVTEYRYDSQGQLDEIKPSSPLVATTITNEADGRPETISVGELHKTKITYNKLGQVTKIAYTGSGTEKSVKYAYSPNGTIEKREDSTGTTKYKYDALNRLTKEELPGSITNSYEYDAASNLTALIDASGTTSYKYNGLNEAASLTVPTTSTPIEFTYNGDQGLTSITYPSGAKDVFKLEAATGRPETITAEDTTGLAIPKLSYAYANSESDDTGLIQMRTESTTGAKTTYKYDPLNRLKEAVTKASEAKNQARYAFKLDGDGNRLKQEVNLEGEKEGTATFYDYNGANELECRQTVENSGSCTESSTTELSHYSYDSEGEQTAITPKHDTSGATFTYNDASELSALTPSGGSEEKLEYGGTGQDDLTKVGSITIDNSLLGVTSETTSSGTTYYGRMPDGLLIDERTPSGIYNPMFDAQGDIIALVATNAKVEETFHYGPYGENIKSEGTVPYPFGYKSGYRLPVGNTGQGNIPNSLIHYGQRYYDPTTGRWTQQDPEDKFSSATQGDRFLFTGADPLNLSDPSGLNESGEVFSYILTAAGCLTSDNPASIAICAGGLYNIGTEENPEGPIEDFEEGLEKAVDFGA